MLKFLATVENTIKIQREDSSYNQGKLLENTRIQLLSAKLPEFCDTSRPILFPIENQEFRKSNREERSIGPE